MKKIAFFLAAAALFGQCPCPPIDTCAPVDCAFLPASRRCQLANNCLENSDIYAIFDFLWWEGTERGLEYASKNANATFDQEIQLYEPDFGFHPAIRLGLGYHLSYDDWDLEFDYTRYYTSTTNHAKHRFSGNPFGGIRSVWTSPTAFQNTNFRTLWQDAEVKWSLQANIFDLYLKHRLCISTAITLEPALGLKLALLQQRYKVLYQNGNTVQVDIGRGAEPVQYINSSIAMKNRSINFGPSASVMTRWNLWDHYDFLASLSGSLLAARFSIGRNESDTSFTDAVQIDSLREGDTYWTLRPQASTSFGFGYSNCICRPNKVIYYGSSFSYEAGVYWKQNMLYRFINQTNAAMIAPTQGDLFFHGLTVDAFIDF